MTASPRPNFFLLLALNPSEQWDTERYQQALQQKTAQWSRESQGVTKKALAAQINRTLLPQVQEVMENPVLRENEAVAARNLLARFYRMKHDQFERQLTLLNLKDTAEPEEIAAFISDFKHILQPDEIRKRITVKIASTTDAGTGQPQELDASLLKNITDRLEILHMKTLYELLQASNKEETASLLHISEELYTSLVRLQPSVESTVKMELAGFATTIFQSETMRACYDTTIQMQSLQHFFKDLDDSMRRAANKELSPRQILFYLEEACQAGWDEDEALQQLKMHARLHHWFLILPY
jgi:hypothetical protein